MDNLLNLAVPSDPIDRIHAFARDLAFGALNGYWKPGLTTVTYGGGVEQFMLHGPYAEEHERAFMQKWEDDHPSFEILRSFDYLTFDKESVYYITQQAFRLLEQPVTPPSVFISYRRGIGSPFGLAIEYRLQARGIRPFIDRSLDGGDKWQQVLEARVRESHYFVCLLSDEALESPHVRAEIQWALDSRTLLIPIWNKDFDLSGLAKHQLELLATYNAILVMGDRAEDYHNAVEKLLNRLGYTLAT